MEKIHGKDLAECSLHVAGRQRMGLTGNIVTLFEVKNEPLFVGFSKARGKKAKKLAEDFGRILEEMRKTGELKKIMEKY